MSFPKEFDKAASRQVQHMFEEIEKELYEGRGGGAGILQGLQDECQQWATRFPHLRYFTHSFPPTLRLFVVLFIVGVCQDCGDPGGVSRGRGLPVVRYFRQEQLEEHAGSQREQCVEPTERQGQ